MKNIFFITIILVIIRVAKKKCFLKILREINQILFYAHQNNQTWLLNSINYINT